MPGQLSLLGECLDAEDRAVLAFAREHHLAGRVSHRVEAELGISEVRYLQLLAGLIRRVEAADAEPELVAALRARRDRRRRGEPARG